MPAATKNITLQEDKPSLRVTSVYVNSAFLRKQSDFAFLEVLNPSEIALFHEISPSDVPRVHPCKTLLPFKLYPMDRAEVLHAQSSDLNGRRKNTPGENELVLSCEIIDFPLKTYT